MVDKEKVLEYLKENEAEIRLVELGNVGLYITGCLDPADWDLEDDEKWLYVVNDGNDNTVQVAWNKKEALGFLNKIMKGMYGQDPIQALEIAYETMIKIQAGNNA